MPIGCRNCGKLLIRAGGALGIVIMTLCGYLLMQCGQFLQMQMSLPCHHIIVTWAGATMTGLSYAVLPWAVCPCPLDLLMLLFGQGCVLEDAVCPRPVPRPRPWPIHLGCSPSSTSDGDVASIGGDICGSLPDLEVTSALPMTQKLELGQGYASLEPLVVMAAERGCTRVYT